MAKVFAIDPGPTQSAFVVWDGKESSECLKLDNIAVLEAIEFHKKTNNRKFVIEQVRSYGMPVGASIFDTVHWSGRFHQSAGGAFLMPRKDVKMHLCQTNRAKDSNIIQALVDRFAYGKKNKGKGTIKEPGFFYGFKSDIWQAFALAVTYYDLKIKGK